MASAGAMERGPQNPTRAQPVEKIHMAFLRGRNGQSTPRTQDAGDEGSPNAGQNYSGQQAQSEKLGGGSALMVAPAVQPFGPSAPFMAHLIAHEMGALRGPSMPSELQGFYRYTPADAYQEVANRDSLVAVYAPPAEAAI